MMPGCICAEETPEAVDLCGVDVNAVTIDDAITRIGNLLDCGHSHVVHQVSVDPIVRARRDPHLRAVMSRSALNVPDSVGVTWGLRRIGSIRVDRVPGADLMTAVLGWGVDRDVTHAFVGSTPATVERLATVVRSTIPGVRIIDPVSPPFRRITETGVRDDLGSLGASPDILWVCLGTPKQHLWADIAQRYSAATVIVTVGAAFDFISGTRSRGPVVMRDHGLEWLYRLVDEPRRLWRRYLIGNPAFVLHVERQRWRSRLEH